MGLVVKKGSNTRDATSGSMPGPLSPTMITTQPCCDELCGLSMSSRSWAVAFRAVRRTSPPLGMASRAFSARLTSASSSSLGSTQTRAVSGATCTRISKRLPSTLRTSRSTSVKPWSNTSACGCTGRRPANRSRCCVNWLPVSTARKVAASGTCRSAAAGCREIRCALLLTTPSRLLKSCAMPPVRQPSASTR